MIRTYSSVIFAQREKKTRSLQTIIALNSTTEHSIHFRKFQSGKALPPFPKQRPFRPANYDELEEYRSRGRDSNPPEAQPPLAPMAGQADSAIDIPPQIIKEGGRIWRCVFKDPKRGYCGRTFTKEATAFRHHGEVHRGLRLVCPECEKPAYGYKNASVLKDHMCRVHKNLDQKARKRIIQTLFNDQDCDSPGCTEKIDGHTYHTSRK